MLGSELTKVTITAPRLRLSADCCPWKLTAGADKPFVPISLQRLIGPFGRMLSQKSKLLPPILQSNGAFENRCDLCHFGSDRVPRACMGGCVSHQHDHNSNGGATSQ